ncbi:MAG: amidohydrolase family protein [Candidatus Dormiibacterota bacterium]
MVVLPGIVNAHDHLDQSLYRGCTDGHVNPRSVLLRLARGMTRERARAAASVTLLELLHHGVTTTHESHWTHYHKDSTDGICEAIQHSRMRALVARSMNDLPDQTPPEFCESLEDVIADLDRLERAYDSDRVTITCEPTTMTRCSARSITSLHDWASERHKIWHVHLSQDREETLLALERFGMGSVQFAEKLGVLGPTTLAAHCAGILPEEAQLLEDRHVALAHCPDTVARAGGQVPPIWDLLRNGAIVGLGTDGSATNNGQNPWEAMKLAVYLQRIKFGDPRLGNAQQALELSTRGGSQALGLAGRVGALEAGKSADIAIFPRGVPHLQPDLALVNNLVFSGLNNMADTVLVSGEVLLSKGASTLVDEREVIAYAREAQQDLLRETGVTVPVGAVTG